MSRCLSAPDATSLHHCLKNHRQYFTILSLIQALDTKRPVASSSPFYPSTVLFQLHRGHGQSLVSLARSDLVKGLTSETTSPFADQTTSRIFANWKRKELCFRRGSPLACGVMGITFCTCVRGMSVCHIYIAELRHFHT